MRPSPVRRRLHRGRIAALAAVFILALVLGFRFAWPRVAGFAGGVAARVALGSHPLNLLLIANNARGVPANQPLGLGTAAGQADTMILVHVDPAAHAFYAIPIPRDALIAQPGWDDPVPKIKTLFFMGDQETPPKGPQLLADAVARLTGLPMDGYAAINFAGFERAVDAVGGLTIDVKKRIYDPRHSGADFRPGVQHMNGAQVLAFVRVRQNEAGNDYRVNDFQRMQAEVQVLGLLRDKLLNPATAATLIPRFVREMRADVATNVPQDELVRIGIAMAGAPVYQVPIASLNASMWLAATPLPGANARGFIDGSYYDVLDPAEVCAKLAQFGAHDCTTGLPPMPPPATIPVTLYGTHHLALHLEHLGYTHVALAGGPTQADPATVLYPAGHPEWGWAVARAIGQGDEQVEPAGVERVTIYE